MRLPMGFGVVTREDDVFEIPAATLKRHRIEPESIKELVAGDMQEVLHRPRNFVSVA